jgi:S1-C subfamily serine protease
MLKPAFTASRVEPRAMRSLLPRAAGLTLAALLGAGLALGGAALFGSLGAPTTTIREVQNVGPSSESVAFPQPKRALSIRDVYSRDAPGVVQVTSTSIVQVPADPFFGNGFPQQQEQQALGSGFVIDKAGHIITNYHVIAGARSVKVSFSNNESLTARVVGKDPSTDIAVLQVKASSRALTPLPLGNSDDVHVGDSVIAIGNPFGLDRTVTAGIVSALQRPITAPNGYTIDHVIQTDAALNHGNSGGPLINAEAQVIGVNAQIQTGGTTDGNVGVGFAIPINTVKAVVAQLIKTGQIEHAFLGINVRGITPDLAKVFRLPVGYGLLVEGVGPRSGAAKAGLKGGRTQVTVAGVSYMLGGDVIVAADGIPVHSVARLRDLVAGKRPGDRMRLVIYRGSKKLTIDVTLGRQPTTTQG